MTGILKGILVTVPIFVLSIFAAYFVRMRLEEWRPTAESNSNAIIVGLLTLMTFAAVMMASSRLSAWWLKRRRENDK